MILADDVSCIEDISTALWEGEFYVPEEGMSRICQALPKLYSQLKGLEDQESINYCFIMLSLASAYLRRDSSLFNSSGGHFLNAMVEEVDSLLEELKIDSSGYLH